MKQVNNVVLVSQYDKELGVMEKLEAHQKGLLHRAISVFLFNYQGDMLLQQRSIIKYHSPLLWSNACCSHPMPNESYQSAAQRRIREELGISVKLHPKFHFIYKVNIDTNIIEHELDYVFIGFYSKSIFFNREEIKKIKWISKINLEKQIQEKPDIFTKWFKIILTQYKNIFNMKFYIFLSLFSNIICYYSLFFIKNNE